jgi:hypothetical protein
VAIFSLALAFNDPHNKIIKTHGKGKGKADIKRGDRTEPSPFYARR